MGHGKSTMRIRRPKRQRERFSSIFCIVLLCLTLVLLFEEFLFWPLSSSPSTIQKGQNEPYMQPPQPERQEKATFTTAQPKPIEDPPEDSHQQTDSLQILTETPHSSRRFPLFGSRAFLQQCGWATLPAWEPNCIVYEKIVPTSSEGIADWISFVASGYLIARQAGCRFVFDHLDTVDLQKVLIPCQSDTPKHQLLNWTYPSPSEWDQISRIISARKRKHEGLKEVPVFRQAYSQHENLVGKNISGKLQDLQNALPGFTPETGMACALGHLLCLSPTASQFEPKLFTILLPKLRDERSLVITVYLRTFRSDHVARHEHYGKELEEENSQLMQNHDNKKTLECALKLEEEYLSRALESHQPYSSVAWLVVTDSPYYKQYMNETYGGTSIPSQPSLPREIVTTSARGRHSRPRDGLSTEDFADAFIDWYLMGESDVVLRNHMGATFGSTAALRTARPLYDGRSCAKMEVFHPTIFKRI